MKTVIAAIIMALSFLARAEGKWEYQVVYLPQTPADGPALEKHKSGGFIGRDLSNILNAFDFEGWETFAVTGMSGSQTVYLRRLRKIKDAAE